MAAEACLLAANPMESVLRAIVLDIPGFCFTPQLRIWEHGLYATVDLGDQTLMVAIEAEGFAFHSGCREFRRDCRRYDELVAWGWTVFRFTWEQVMFEPEFVRWCLLSWLATRRGAQVSPPPPHRHGCGDRWSHHGSSRTGQTGRSDRQAVTRPGVLGREHHVFLFEWTAARWQVTLVRYAARPSGGVASRVRSRAVCV
ncbi:MAG: endonuclease domain-containing protein, partial [Actinomycetota bacterium]|nr:endonuclease domain-containing protein [Actinomycetota bacterium]